MCNCRSNCSGGSASPCFDCQNKQSNFVPPHHFKPPYKEYYDMPKPTEELVGIGMGGSQYAFPHPGMMSNATGDNTTSTSWLDKLKEFIPIISSNTAKVVQAVNTPATPTPVTSSSNAIYWVIGSVLLVGVGLLSWHLYKKHKKG